MAYDEALAERIRDRLRDADGVVEKKMFGGLGFLTYGNMTVGVHGDDLIARVAAAADSLLTEPGVRPFDITGRPMRGGFWWPAKSSTTTCWSGGSTLPPRS